MNEEQKKKINLYKYWIGVTQNHIDNYVTISNLGCDYPEELSKSISMAIEIQCMIETRMKSYIEKNGK
jgi:hypothetical protein